MSQESQEQKIEVQKPSTPSRRNLPKPNTSSNAKPTDVSNGQVDTSTDEKKSEAITQPEQTVSTLLNINSPITMPPVIKESISNSNGKQKLEIDIEPEQNESVSTNSNETIKYNFENNAIEKAWVKLLKEGRYAIPPEKFAEFYKSLYNEIVSDLPANSNNTTNTTPPNMKDKIEEKDDGAPMTIGTPKPRGDRGSRVRGDLPKKEPYRKTDAKPSTQTLPQKPTANTGASLDMEALMRRREEMKKQAELKKANSDAINEQNKTSDAETDTQNTFLPALRSRNNTTNDTNKQATDSNSEILLSPSQIKQQQLEQKLNQQNNNSTPQITASPSRRNIPLPNSRTTSQQLNDSKTTEEVKKTIIETSNSINNTPPISNNSTPQITASPSRRNIPLPNSRTTSQQLNDSKTTEEVKKTIIEIPNSINNTAPISNNSTSQVIASPSRRKLPPPNNSSTSNTSTIEDNLLSSTAGQAEKFGLVTQMTTEEQQQKQREEQQKELARQQQLKEKQENSNSSTCNQQ